MEPDGTTRSYRDWLDSRTPAPPAPAPDLEAAAWANMADALAEAANDHEPAQRELYMFDRPSSRDDARAMRTERRRKQAQQKRTADACKKKMKPVKDTAPRCAPGRGGLRAAVRFPRAHVHAPRGAQQPTPPRTRPCTPAGCAT